MTSRVRFFAPTSETDTGRHLALLSKAERFWAAFAHSCGGRQGHWVPELRQQLLDINPGLGLEVRAQPDGTWVLMVLPIAGAFLRPLAELLVSRAPIVAPWLIESSRRPRRLGDSLRILQRDTRLELSAARCRIGLGRGHLVQVVVASHLFSGEADGVAQEAAEQLVELLIGDDAFEDWIEQVSVTPATRPSSLRVLGTEKSELPLLLAQLTDAFEAARAGVWGALPDEPYHRFCENSDWLMFELDDDAELSGHVQPDLQVAGTICPEMLKCFLLGSPFASVRFSRHGERFCYLKLQCAGTPDAQLAQRRRFEDELDFGLVPGRLGCVVGNGIGSQFMYVYLALQQLDESIEWVRRRLRQHESITRCWLLFCDSEWRREWIGLTETSTEPPELSGA